MSDRFCAQNPEHRCEVQQLMLMDEFGKIGWSMSSTPYLINHDSAKALLTGEFISQRERTSGNCQKYEADPQFLIPSTR
jgi:hypothetical protein